jgi:hypothetical protein
MSTRKIVSRIRRGQDALPISSSAMLAGEAPADRVLGARVKKALEKQETRLKAFTAAKKTAGLRQSHYFQAVGSAFEAFCPLTDADMSVLVGMAMTCRQLLDDPERCAEIIARGRQEIEKYVVPTDTIFVVATGLDADRVKSLRAIGLASAQPFLTGKPNIAALLDLALRDGLTVFRFDANLDKIVYIKAGAETEHLPTLLAEHEDLVTREIGRAKPEPDKGEGGGTIDAAPDGVASVPALLKPEEDDSTEGDGTSAVGVDLEDHAGVKLGVEAREASLRNRFTKSAIRPRTVGTR